MNNLEQRLQKYWNENPNEITEEQLRAIKNEIEIPKKDTISDEYFDFKSWCFGYPSRQESFAKYLQKRLKRKNAKKILEVGGGRTARLSRLLSMQGFNMTCIEPKLDIIDNQVRLIKQEFDLHYQLSDYDYVIAQEPCEATEHIVRACIEQNKPFIISLCGVPHKLISGGECKDVYEWYNYLVDLSKDGKIRLRYIELNSFARTAVLIKD